MPRQYSAIHDAQGGIATEVQGSAKNDIRIVHVDPWYDSTFVGIMIFFNARGLLSISVVLRRQGSDRGVDPGLNARI